MYIRALYAYSRIIIHVIGVTTKTLLLADTILYCTCKNYDRKSSKSIKSYAR